MLSLFYAYERYMCERVCVLIYAVRTICLELNIVGFSLESIQRLTSFLLLNPVKSQVKQKNANFTIQHKKINNNFNIHACSTL